VEGIASGYRDQHELLEVDPVVGAFTSLVKFFNSENTTGSLFDHSSELVAGDR
jgi:hypothetical protein